MEVPTTIAPKGGEVHTLRLNNLGTAGYVWNCAIDCNTNLISITTRCSVFSTTVSLGNHAITPQTVLGQSEDSVR